MFKYLDLFPLGSTLDWRKACPSGDPSDDWKWVRFCCTLEELTRLAAPYEPASFSA